MPAANRPGPLRVLLVAGGDRWRPRGRALWRELCRTGVRTELLATLPGCGHRRLGSLADPLLERDVVAAIRRCDPHAVHVLGLGAATSAQLPWLAGALGVPCTAEVDLAELVCRRGDLRHASGQPCATFDDPRRCAACCTRRAADGRGPSRLTAALAAVARPLGPLSPFANAHALAARSEAVRAALVQVERAFAAEDDAAALRRLGAERVESPRSPPASELCTAWELAAASSARGRAG